MQHLIETAWGLARQEEGQGMVEYSLILAFVSVVAAGTLSTIGRDVTGFFHRASHMIRTASGH